LRLQSNFAGRPIPLQKIAAQRPKLDPQFRYRYLF
jgi:hypothetical protein